MSSNGLPTAMIDVMIIAYALAVEKKTIDPSDRNWAKHRNAHHLFNRLETIAISAIAWSQIRRSNNNALSKFVEKWQSRIFVVAADDRVAERAAEIYLQVHGDPRICTRCLGMIPPDACSKCNAQRSLQRATDDIMIAATADITGHITVLYSEDGGVVHLDQYCKNVTIMRPPKAPAVPIPLFSDEHETEVPHDT